MFSQTTTAGGTIIIHPIIIHRRAAEPPGPRTPSPPLHATPKPRKGIGNATAACCIIHVLCLAFSFDRDRIRRCYTKHLFEQQETDFGFAFVGTGPLRREDRPWATAR